MSQTNLHDQLDVRSISKAGGSRNCSQIRKPLPPRLLPKTTGAPVKACRRAVSARMAPPNRSGWARPRRRSRWPRTRQILRAGLKMAGKGGRCLFQLPKRTPTFSWPTPAPPAFPPRLPSRKRDFRLSVLAMSIPAPMGGRSRCFDAAAWAVGPSLIWRLMRDSDMLR
jgi:hypothetical protein